MFLISQSCYKSVPLFPILKNECIEIEFFIQMSSLIIFSDIFFSTSKFGEKKFRVGDKKLGKVG